jgi:NAD-dependent dihydropyrimidine dehydrogenase PreA subunit
MDLTRVDEIIESYDGESSRLVVILQEIQQSCDRLPEPALQRVSDRLGVKLEHVRNVVAFSRSLGLEHMGKALTAFVIDREVCKACGRCRRACPVGAIVGEKKVPHVIDQEKCIRCGVCRERCRMGGISAEWDPDLELVACDVCGAPFATSREVDSARAKVRERSLLEASCPDCRRPLMARRLVAAKRRRTAANINNSASGLTAIEDANPTRGPRIAEHT